MADDGLCKAIDLDDHEPRARPVVHVPAHAKIVSDIHLLNASTTSNTGHADLTLYTLDASVVISKLVAFHVEYDALTIPPHAVSRFTGDCSVASDVSAILAHTRDVVYLDDGRTLGGLNIYSRSSAEITDEARAMAELFATQAAIALGASHQEVNLSEGMASRQLIGQAVGIVMERYRMNEHDAFRFLIRVSSTTNVKMRQVARELVDEANALHH